MASAKFRTHALTRLCGKDQPKLLDTAYNLRFHGVDHQVSMPRIIVCGDQSSGKSSVLQAISGIPFLIKSGGGCTRFPIELIFRKASQAGVHVSIVPDESKSKAERLSLRQFCETLDDFDGLPALIQEAGIIIQKSTFGQGRNVYYRDVLRVEITGPDQPHLTIVDLPGLLPRSLSGEQTAGDGQLVHDLVKSYITTPESIIIAVISAKEDYANQAILNFIRNVDRPGTLTLGVITKPDALTPGSHREASFVSLARNQYDEFDLGWNVLRNTDTSKEETSLQERDTHEARFFSNSIWKDHVGSSLGVNKLRNKLGKVLKKHATADFADLVAEIKSRLELCRHQLDEIGAPRPTLDEQRQYLLQISQRFKSLVKAAMDGSYNDPFFGNPNSTAGSRRHLRAVIQNLSQDFSDDMATRGHRFEVYQQGYNKELVPQGIISLTREEMFERIRTLMLRTRGRELPTMTNPAVVVADLFLEHSAPWEDIAYDYTKSVCGAIEEFLHDAITYIAGRETCQILFTEIFKPALTQLHDDLRSKTEELLMPYRSKHAITFHRDFIAEVERVREDRHVNDAARVLGGFFDVTGNFVIQASQDLTPLARRVVQGTNTNMDLACADAYDCMMIYYKVAMNRFIDDITIYAVEMNVSAHLERMFLPSSVMSMSVDSLNRLAEESEEMRIQRERLTEDLGTLHKALETCKRLADGSGTQQASGAEDSLQKGQDSEVLWSPRLELVVDKKTGVATVKGHLEDLPMSDSPTEDSPAEEL